jgi:phosphoglycolate phosphatase-like HAD superfamily hydrolase
MKSSIRKILLFDLDWTLVYTGGAGIRALEHAFERLYAIPQAMQTIKPDGKTDPAICREMIQTLLKRDPKPAEIDVLCQGYLERLAFEITSSEGYRILPGIPELLNALASRANILLGLGTGNLEKGAQIKLARADLMRFFRFGGFGSDAEARPEVLRTGARRGEAIAGHAISPSDIIVIGDHIRDVQAGQAIGATTVAVASGPMSYDELTATDPHFIFQDLSDTAAVLKVLG